MAETRSLRVVGKEPVADGVVALTLADPDKARLPDWTPGAHIDLILPDGSVRQYSLCGDRWDACSYRIAVLREPNGRGGSAYIHDALDLGDAVGLGGPRNNFPLVPAQRYLFIAGGIGITPLLPMIAQADLLGADWRLLYGGRREASLAFGHDLAGYGDRVHLRPEDRYGLLDLPGFLSGWQPGTRVYCCGPAPLLAAVERAGAGLPPHSLRTERFAACTPTGPARSTPFEIELARSKTVLTVPADSSVLDVLTKAGADVLSSCRQGVCGTCEVTVLSGEPDHRDSVLNDTERAAGTCMFACVSRSRSDRLVVDL
ncbi:PDR/VanB family oxidoreductase [Actinoplanes derwentensis]|uniref:Ferredoxin-NADP reductase n=1 Tax=Actinoplanes derwentensis TaxID=113562 RepID=A0A1H1XJU4_9ACTN|nr:PDR/VanB family oxidoreductase [Actinoplanes derwentensis]GID87760.1 ferredoxin [Actinoplanes derwentensis]SDT09524.1 Ferredoxin-NADP reductase [Actinoplanes derwentensis]